MPSDPRFHECVADSDGRFAHWGALAVEVGNPSILKTAHSPVISFPVDLYLSRRMAPERSALPR
jgi:hypothetical protein